MIIHPQLYYEMKSPIDHKKGLALGNPWNNYWPLSIW